MNTGCRNHNSANEEPDRPSAEKWATRRAAIKAGMALTGGIILGTYVKPSMCSFQIDQTFAQGSPPGLPKAGEPVPMPDVPDAARGAQTARREEPIKGDSTASEPEAAQGRQALSALPRETRARAELAVPGLLGLGMIGIGSLLRRLSDTDHER
jgi:hypothetical protein